MAFYKPTEFPRLIVVPNRARRIKKDHPAAPLTINEAE